MTDRGQTWSDRFLSVVGDPAVGNYIAQVRAKALLTELVGSSSSAKWTYDSSLLVKNFIAADFALDRLLRLGVARAPEVELGSKKLAMGWEALSKLGEGTRSNSGRLNAAIDYDISGFTANGICLARSVKEDTSNATSGTTVGLTALFLNRQFIQLRQRCIELIRPPSEPSATSPGLVDRLVDGTIARGFLEGLTYFLRGEERGVADAIETFQQAESSAASLGLVEEANLLRRLNTLFPIVRQRSIWKHLSEALPQSPHWTRYLRLLARGTRQDILSGPSVSELWPSQISALTGGLLSTTSSKIFRMPTSAGKTRVAELAIVHSLLSNPGSKCIYIAPYRALVAELEQVLLNLFSDLGFRVSTVMGTYETDDFEEVLSLDSDILVATPEKLDLLLRAQPDFLSQVRLFVLDEGQIVTDPSRGAKFELLLSRLRRRLPHARFLFISAVVPQETLEDFAKWFGGDPKRDLTVSEWRPSTQRIATFEWRGDVGTIRYQPTDDFPSQRPFVPGIIAPKRYELPKKAGSRLSSVIFPAKTDRSQIAVELAIRFASGGPVLVFCSQRNHLPALAHEMLHRISLFELAREALPACLTPSTTPLRSLSVARMWLGADHDVTKLLANRVGIHHGMLPNAVREAVESDFRKRKLSILFSTSTLAQGVNLPIRTVIFHTWHRYDRSSQRHVRIPAAEYWNIAGRAGRATEETEGTVVHVAVDPSDLRDFQSYLRERSSPPPLKSALFQMLSDLVSSRTTLAEVQDRLDPEILALVAEQDPGMADLVETGAVLEGSLTFVQGNRNHVSLKPLVTAMRGRAKEIRERLSPGQYALLSSTGLSSRSCVQLVDQVNEARDRISKVIGLASEEDLDTIFSLLWEGTRHLKEMAPQRALHIDTFEVLRKWIRAATMPDLAPVFAKGGIGIEDAARYVEDLFGYRLPWGFSAYLRVAYSQLGKEESECSPFVRYAPAMTKYGLPIPSACWAMAAGVPTRPTALVLGRQFDSTGLAASPRAFLEWLAAVDLESIEGLAPDSEVNRPELVESVSRAKANRLISEFGISERALPLVCEVKGTFVGDRPRIAQQLNVGVVVSLRRDYSNPFDRNAVEVLWDNSSVGYIERGVAQLIGPDLDNGLEIQAKVHAVRLGGTPKISIEVQRAEPP